MREIKFKQYYQHEETGTISTALWGKIDWEKNAATDFITFTSPGSNNRVYPIADCQYTGLKDKNGREIFESDIVKYYQPYAKKWETHIVQWDDRWACFGLFEKDNEWCKESDWVKIREIEVIGNIYENPELL